VAAVLSSGLSALLSGRLQGGIDKGSTGLSRWSIWQVCTDKTAQRLRRNGEIVSLINNAVPVDLKSVAKACRSRDYTFPKGLFAVRSAWCGSSAVL
jgi:hypothetical protein